MPTYDFACLDCGRKFEVFATVSQKEEGLQPRCPHCGGSQVVQVFGGVNVIAGGSRGGSEPSGGCGCGGACGCN